MPDDDVRNEEEPMSDDPGFTVITETIRKNVSSIEELAPQQLNSLFHPLPGGVDYLPSAFFLSSCDTLGLRSTGIVAFACSLEALSMSWRALVPLMREGRKSLASSPDHKRAEGMNLLLVDGLVLLSYRFLTDLGNRELPLLAPIIVERTRLWTEQVCAPVKRGDGVAAGQNALLDIALRAVRLLSEKGDSSLEVVESLAARIENILAELRNSKNEEGKRSAIQKLGELSESLSLSSDKYLPLVRYVALITGTL